ncbi:hypothetical protein Cantr_03100 [Candida viswanathii]|uniref:Uncharacterized protein n=1 Tax=Candida viswanathii TaxID=5486 RepID=A0A367YPN7_9ASCO|nr:hypothetical protein Cantr_03100 [Candida viswanathii]
MPESNLEDTVYQDAVSFTYPYDRVYPQMDSSIVKTPTILQKLPDNSLSSLNFNTTRQERKQVQKQEEVVDEPLPTSTSSILRDASFKVLQTKLSLKQQKKEDQEELERIKRLDRPMYYKPPSSNFKDSFYGIKDCVPPNVKLLDQETASDRLTKNRIPIFVNYEETKHDPKEVLQSIRDEFDEGDLDDYVTDNPTGAWENPIVKKALSRQVDLEHQLRVLLKNVLYLMVFSFFKSSISKFVSIYELKLKTSQQPAYVNQEHNTSSSLEFYLLLLSKVVVVYFIINIVVPLIRLLKGQDQCYDLPLSIKQRKLLGLKVKDVPEDYVIDEKAELTLKQRRYDLDNEGKQPYKPIPKYNKLNDYSIFNINKKLSTDVVKSQSLYQVRKDDPTALSNQSTVGIKFLRSKSRDTNVSSKYSPETINKAQNKFEKNFDIKFNFT